MLEINKMKRTVKNFIGIISVIIFSSGNLFPFKDIRNIDWEHTYKIQDQDDSIEKERREFKKGVNKKLNEIDRQIRDIRFDLTQKGRKANEDWNTELKKLESSRRELKRKMDRTALKSKENWNKFQSDVNQELDEFSKSVEAFWKKEEK